MSVFIIGGDGFLGSVFNRRLLRNGFVTRVGDIEPRSLSSEYLDVEDETSLNIIRDAEIVVNLAAEHRDNVTPLSKYYDVNVAGAKNVCAAARKFGVKKIVFTSSVAIYGFAQPGTSEGATPNPFNEYGRSKLLAEDEYKRWLAEAPNERSLVIIRPTVIFGNGNRGNVYNLLNQIARRRFVMFGNGKNKKSIAYVENVASFMEYCMGLGPGLHLYNYADSPDLDMNTFVSTVRQQLFGKKNIGLRLPGFIGLGVGYLFDVASFLSNKKFTVSSIRIKKFMADSIFRSAAHSTGFEPEVSLEDALRATVNFEFGEENAEQ